MRLISLYLVYNDIEEGINKIRGRIAALTISIDVMNREVLSTQSASSSMVCERGQGMAMMMMTMMLIMMMIMIVMMMEMTMMIVIRKILAVIVMMMTITFPKRLL